MWSHPRLCGAINVYLKMCGFSQNPTVFHRAVTRRMISWWRAEMRVLGGVAANGAEGDGDPSGFSLMKPKRLVGLSKSTKVHQP